MWWSGKGKCSTTLAILCLLVPYTTGPFPMLLSLFLMSLFRRDTLGVELNIFFNYPVHSDCGKTVEYGKIVSVKASKL